MSRLTVSILVDDPGSWIVPYAQELYDYISDRHKAALVFDQQEVPSGDLLFLLGCTKIVPEHILARNRNNVVVHESALPRGRGWSPLAWQVLEGKNRIPLALFEATSELDAGPIYLEDHIELNGTELLPEIRRLQGEKTLDMVKAFLARWPDVELRPQTGEPTFYPKRTRRDDKLDVHRTLAENFDHLRIVDNEKYPAWFTLRGKTYLLKIYQADEEATG